MPTLRDNTSRIAPFDEPLMNVADLLRASAEAAPHQTAVIVSHRPDHVQGRTSVTFRELDQEVDRLARGLRAMGIKPRDRIVLLVRPGIEFIALVYALHRIAAVLVLIDPGMGLGPALRSLQEINPDGFIGIPAAQLVRRVRRRMFPNARHNVVLARRWLGSESRYMDVLGGPWTPTEAARTRAEDPAAILFTSGSTGPAKGVSYTHGIFTAQVRLLRDFYGVQPGEINLAGFAPFALFDAAMQVTTVIPDMDPTRPAKADPRKIVRGIQDHGVTQAFGSPALWNPVGQYCEQHGVTLPTLRRVMSAGAPVPPHVIKRMRAALVVDDADIHTPYGATESLPVASISGREVLERLRKGAGTCVGHVFPEIAVKIIAITDEPIASIQDARELAPGEVGEIIVRGPTVTREYYGRPEATAAAKIADGEGFWHRMGDVGYLDDAGLLWYCGRKSHRVETAESVLFTDPCESIFNEHPRVFRTALVGVGPRGPHTPVIIVEPEQGEFPRHANARRRFTDELRAIGEANESTRGIGHFLFHKSLPVDIRHNAKISRESLAVWAARQVSSDRSGN